MSDVKPWWQSKTIWFNAFIAGLAALEASAHVIQPYVPGNVYGFGLVALTVGNTMLRAVTKQGITK